MYAIGGGRIETETGHDWRNYLLLPTLPTSPDNGGDGKAFQITLRSSLRRGEQDVSRNRQYAEAIYELWGYRKDNCKER